MLLAKPSQPCRRHPGLAEVQAPQAGKFRQTAECFVADRGVREIEARQVAERLQIRRRGVVDPLDVPQTQAPQVPQIREALQAIRSNRRTAHIQMLKLLELRELRQTEVRDACAAGNAAFGFAVRGAEIARTCRAEGNARADIQILEPAQQRDGVELEISDDRRPAPAGIAALDAVETELPKFWQQLQHMQTGAADLVASEVQLFELRQRGQMFQTDVRDLREADVERLQLRQFGDVGEAGVGDVRPSQVQAFQLTVSA